MTQSTMQFDHQGSFIKVEHAATDLLEVEIQFKTLKPDTIILYTQTVSDTDQDTGYIQVRSSICRRWLSYLRQFLLSPETRSCEVIKSTAQQFLVRSVQNYSMYRFW